MFNIDELRHEIEALIRDYPELETDEVLRLDMLEGQTDLKGVLTTLLHTVNSSEDLLDGLTNRLREEKARKARLERRVEYARGLMLKVLQSADLKKVELPQATISQRAGTPQIVGEIDVDALPDDLVKIKREPDRIKIRQDLIDHRELPGIALSNAPPTLVISK